MADLIYLSIIAAFFLLAIGYITFCDRLSKTEEK